MSGAACPSTSAPAPGIRGSGRDSLGRFAGVGVSALSAALRGRVTTEGSRSHLIAETAKAAAVAAGRGLTVREHATAYERATGAPAPASYDAEFGSLRKRGFLVPVGGRCGRTRFAHRDALVPAGDDEDDDALAVLRALRSAYRRHGRPVTTREVTEEIRLLGIRLTATQPNAVRSRLATLARERQRGAADWGPPLVVREPEESELGRPTARWRPADVAPPAGAVLAPRSCSDAVRGAVRAARTALGRPLARVELRWWAEAHAGGDPAAAALDLSRLARDVAFTAQADAQGAGDTRRLHVVAGDASCAGGAPPRYSIGPAMEAERLACAVEDALHALRPADELREIDLLERQAARLAAPALARFAALRRTTLRHALWTVLGPVTPAEVAVAVQAAARSLDVLQGWVEGARISDDARYTRRREIEARREQLAALPAALGPAVPGRTRGARCRIVGQAALVPLTEMDPVAEAACRERGEEPTWHRRRKLLEAVRRFPNPAAAGAERLRPARGAVPPRALDRSQEASEGSTEPLALVDRVDAFLALYDSVAAPRTAALLTSARHLLGRVVRDPAAVRPLVATGVREPVVRRAAAVALGLLGVAPAAASLDALLAGEPLDVAAALLATVAADPQAALTLALRVERSQVGAAWQLANAARVRLERGRLASAVG